MQVVAPLAEGDAARIQAGQTASLTFDALPNLTLTGHVLAASPASTVISNVTNYYVTVTLDALDPRIKSGMTANASVVVSQAANVLAVSNSAITRIGGNAFVTVLEKDGKTQRVPIHTGVVGDTQTEIVSGLQAGQKIVLPQLRLPTGTGTVRPGGGGVRAG